MRAAASSAIIVALLASTMILGVVLRLADPLSTRALGAEDPYTHIVFTQEWLDQGYFADSHQMGTALYPPGMHAFLGAFVPFTGVSMYDFARIAPAFIGGLAILGMFVLANRLAGPVAGLGAAFLTAIIPEHIFRTNLLFPTGFDLALLPLWIFAFLLVLDGRRAGAWLFAGAGVPLAIMHPWVVPLFAAPLAVYAALRVLRTRASARSLRLPAALLVGVTAFAMAFRWDESGTGFSDFLAHAPGLAWITAANLPPPVILLIVLPLLAGAATLAVGLVALLARVRLTPTARVVVSVATGAALLALLPFILRGVPTQVSYERMLAPLAIGLGLAGFALAFVRPTALGDLGVAISALLFPLTAINFFDSPFWPNRTVVFLSVGVALLGANVFAQLAELPLRVPRFASSRATSTATVIVVALLATGAVVAQPIDTYDWYRLYDEEEFAGFEKVVEIVGGESGARVFIYTWQPALFVKTLGDPHDVWYSPKYFHEDDATRAKQTPQVRGTAYVLVDKHTREADEEGNADLGFLSDGSRYREAYSTPSGSLVLYEVRS